MFAETSLGLLSALLAPGEGHGHASRSGQENPKTDARLGAGPRAREALRAAEGLAPAAVSRDEAVAGRAIRLGAGVAGLRVGELAVVGAGLTPGEGVTPGVGAGSTPSRVSPMISGLWSEER